MSLSDFEIQKIAEIVAGKVGAQLDAKQLRKVVDSVVDNMTQNNPEIKGATCEVSAGNPPRSTYNPQRMNQRYSNEQEAIAPEGGLYDRIENTDKNRIIIAAFGKNRPGVVASITKILAENNCSIEDISQTLLQEFFSMIMVVNISGFQSDFATLREHIKKTEAELGMQVYVMHEDIFRYMHRI